MKYSESLKKNNDFQLVYKTGTSYANRYLVMYLIRESYRLNEEKFCCGYDIVVVVRVNGKNQNYHSLESALLHLGRLHKVVRSKENEKNTNNID